MKHHIARLFALVTLLGLFAVSAAKAEEPAKEEPAKEEPKQEAPTDSSKQDDSKSDKPSPDTEKKE